MPTKSSFNGSAWLRLPHLTAELGRVVEVDGGREFHIRCATLGRPIPPRRRCCRRPILLNNGAKTIKVRDRRIEPMPTYLLIRRQRFKCRTCGRTSYEVLPDVDDDHAITRRLRDDIALSAVKRSFADAATVHRIEPTLVRRVFLAYAAEQLRNYEIDMPRVMGVDENRILGGDRFVCMDLERGMLLDMLETREVPTLTAYFERMANHHRVEVWCQDMWHGYRSIAQRFFPKAHIVIDRFHVIRYVNEAVDSARIAYQASLPDAERRKLKPKNRLFLARWEKMAGENQDRLATAVKDFPFLGDAYGYKERFFDLYELDSRERAETAYAAWRDGMPPDLCKFFRPVITMMKNWGHLIFNYYEAKYISGVVERMNRSINQISSAGYGFDFEMLRTKALLRYGNITPLGDLREFEPMSLEPDERVARLDQPVVFGMDPSTLVRALNRGQF
jgi:transposase